MKHVHTFESFINEGKLNEELGLSAEIALGIVGGFAGIWALVKGLPMVGSVLGAGAQALADAAEKKVKDAARKQRKELVSEIVKKFENDNDLKKMYQDLPPYNGKDDRERRKQMTAIAKYIKSKLTAEETQYFNEVSSMLRTGNIK